MKNRARRAFFIATIAGGATLVVASFYYGQNIPFSKQWPLYEALRTTAAIIFAVVGAWLAIIYPDRLRYAFLGKKAGEVRSNGAMDKVLSPAVNSTAILCVILLLGVIAPIVSQFNFLTSWTRELRGMSYAILALLTLWQLGTIFMTLPIADQVKSESDKEILKEKTKKDIFSLVQHDERR